ncbi:MAG: hypothetical protein ACYTEW_26280 [Planctomycetota bacterium]|jgi:hypothetical protein
MPDICQHNKAIIECEICDQYWQSALAKDGQICKLRHELAIKKHRIRFLEKANEEWASKFEKLAGKKK